MAVLRSVVVKIGADISELQKGLGDASKALDKAGKSLSSIGGTLTKGLTLPIAAAGTGLLKLGMDFDEAFDKIRVGTGATGEALEGLQDDFKAVYSSVPSGMENVSQAIADLNTRTGLAGKPLQELSAQMLNLSRITGEDLSSMIANSSRLFGDWSISADKTGSTMDYLFKVSQSTGIGFNDLNSKLVQFGAPLRQMGFDIETSAAMLGKFEKEGVNTELVLGGLRIALGKMAKEGITDTSAALAEVTRQIKEAGSTGEANRISLELFGARIGPDMAAAIREGRFELSELVTGLKASSETINGAAFETISFNDKLAIMKNKAAVALEPLGSNLMTAINNAMPAIEGLLGKLSDVVTWFGNLDSGSQTMILSFIGIAAAIGPALTLIGNLTSGIGSAVNAVKWLADANNLAAIKTAIMTGVQKAAAAAQWLLNAAMSANPIMLVVIAVAALVAAIIHLWNTNEDFRNAVIAIWDSIKTAASNLYRGIKNTFETIASFISNFIKNAAQWGLNLVKGIADGIKAGVKWVKDAVAGVADGIKKFLGFSSPTEEGPGSESDKWMPNLFSMLQSGINDAVPALNASLSAAMNPELDIYRPSIAENQAQRAAVSINITGNYIRDEDDVERIAEQLVRRLKLLGVYA